jgi:16S rRNA (cytidine1402-2'-O)-methyltransferase
MNGKLILLPNVFDRTLPHAPFLPETLKETVETLQGLITESEKEARYFLRRFLPHDRMSTLPLALLNEHTTQAQLQDLLKPMIEKNETWGLISDAGLPCIADPGAPLVFLARQKNISIEAIPGPSSIILSLQLSGFSGQAFFFHGYLPKEEHELKAKLLELEKNSHAATQIWIEAPYRTEKMIHFLLQTLKPTTYFSLAEDLTFPTQKVTTLQISEWRKQTIQPGKRPAVFLIMDILA